MRVVRKYTFDCKSILDPEFEIPGGGQFLYARFQEFDRLGFRNDPTKVLYIDTWWAVETENDPVKVQLHARATGEEVPPSVTYRATVFPQPMLTLHIWQRDEAFVDMQIVDGKFVPKS